MADLSDAQRKRAEARQRRRSQDDAPPDEADAGENGGGEQPLQAVKHAAKVAAAVGAAGAAAAAAKALASHQDDGDDEEQEPEDHTSEEPQAEQADAQQPEAEEPEQEDGSVPEQRDEEPVAGTAASEARQVIDQAREQLGDLLERPVETVSSLERTHDGWVAQLEVVELTRIPESTDVLATYELELDGDLNLRRYQQLRRYTRSQASRGERE